MWRAVAGEGLSPGGLRGGCDQPGAAGAHLGVVAGVKTIVRRQHQAPAGEREWRVVVSEPELQKGG